MVALHRASLRPGFPLEGLLAALGNRDHAFPRDSICAYLCLSTCLLTYNTDNKEKLRSYGMKWTGACSIAGKIGVSVLQNTLSETNLERIADHKMLGC